MTLQVGQHDFYHVLEIVLLNYSMFMFIDLYSLLRFKTWVFKVSYGNYTRNVFAKQVIYLTHQRISNLLNIDAF